jgi:hypothetical protein
MNPLEQLRGEPMVICERCQMKVPERLATFGIGVRGGDAAWCAACKTPEGAEGQGKRAEVIELRKAHLLRGQPGVTHIIEGVSHQVRPAGASAPAPPQPEPVKWFPVTPAMTTTQAEMSGPSPKQIPWSVAEKAYSVYQARYGGQSLERVAERGGWYAKELDDLFPGWREESSEITALREGLAAAEAREREADFEITVLRRALGEDSDELQREVTRRREAFRHVLVRAEAAEAHLADLRAVCGEAYQACGALDAPVRVLDNLSAAAAGKPLPHATMLPVLDRESALADLRGQAQALRDDLHVEGTIIDSFNATMGTGYRVAAERLSALLAALPDHHKERA